jgi:uncharacterized protein
MIKKARPRVKHIPQRTCVGCRQTLAKRSLIRLVRSSEGVVIDLSGKLPGRGAYLHNVRSCWEAGLKGSLAHALRIELSDDDRNRIRDFTANLAEDGPETV